MTPTSIRVGIIGLGAIGQRLIKGFREAPQAAITFVTDINADVAASTAAELGGIEHSTDYRAMLDGDHVDLVYVAVPPRFHHPIALAVVEAGKHILCEKPLALNLAEAREMTQRAKKAGVVHAVNLPLFYSPGIRVFHEQIARGYLGDLRRINLNLVFPQWPRAWQMTPWVGQREQGGPLREVGPHIIEVIRRCFGPVKRVWAEMEYPADPKASEIGAIGVLELASGRFVNVSVMANLPRPEEVSLTAYGTAGTLGLTSWHNPIGSQAGGELRPLPVPDADLPGLIANLLRAVRGERSELAGFDSGLAIQGVLEAWERAAQTGGWVEVEE